MTEDKTASILLRLPKILAVTAASYGLDLQSPARRANGSVHRGSARNQRPERHRMMRETMAA